MTRIDNPTTNAHGSYGLGVAFLVLVALIWTLASIVVQRLYQNYEFDSPFLLTYICTSLFVVLLPSRMLYERCNPGNIQIPWTSNSLVAQISSAKDMTDECRLLKSEDAPSIMAEHEHDASSEGTDLASQESQYYQQQLPIDSTQSSNSLTSALSEITASGHMNMSLELTNATDKSQLQAEKDTLKPNPIKAADAKVDNQEEKQVIQLLGHVEHFKIAFCIAPIWFISNFAYNISLKYTSIASSTVLASSGSLFTYLFAILLREERFTTWRTLGVLLCVSGSILTGLNDYHPEADSDNIDLTMNLNIDNSTFPVDDQALPVQMRIWGDLTGTVAAVGYGLYTVLIKRLCPSNEEAMSMQLVFGYIGLVNMTLLSPFVIGLWWDHSTSITGITSIVLGWIVLKGLLDNVLSDYLWARAVVLTSATVATVGLGLTIPLAFLSDVLVMGQSTENIFAPNSIIGAISVFCGFILVNCHHEESDIRVSKSYDAHQLLDAEEGEAEIDLQEQEERTALTITTQV